MLKKFWKIPMSTVLTAVLLTAVGTAQAGVKLYWDAGDTVTIAPGDTVRLAIKLDDIINLRTAEVTVQYDTTVVRSLGGGPGAVFQNSGHFIFDGFEESGDIWHGFAIVMAAGEYVSGPGELLYWDVVGIAPGTSSVTSIQSRIYDENSPPALLDEVVLDNGTIIVQDPFTAVQDVPAAGIQLRIAPNPFNPRTRVSFFVPEETAARLAVFDTRGREVAVLLDGLAPSGPLAVDWNGTDDAGRTQPGGVYLFQLVTRSGTARSKGLLVK